MFVAEGEKIISELVNSPFFSLKTCIQQAHFWEY